MKQIAIIGNGIAGVTAALNIRQQSNDAIYIISSETTYFYSRTALMYIYMGHMQFEHTQPYENNFWKKNKISLLLNHVVKVDTQKSTLIFQDGNQLDFDSLIIASGSKPNQFSGKGENLNGVTSLYSKQDLDKIESLSISKQKAVVVGGGLIGIELAEMFHSRAIPVTFLVREKTFWGNVLPHEESQMITNHILEHKIDLRLETTLAEISGETNVESVTTSHGDVIPADKVGITVGVSPNIDFLKDSKIEINKGILVNEYLETNIKNIYAIGDCAEKNYLSEDRKPIESVWYTGKIMGETVAKTICGTPTKYNPGHWFNSAKFFDIEYQTYGWVFPTAKANETHFYWEDAKHNKAVRFVYETETKKFIGVNTLGIRMRHDFFDTILSEKKSIDDVIENLPYAIFDPEFSTSYYKKIQTEFRSQFELKTIKNG